MKVKHINDTTTIDEVQDGGVFMLADKGDHIYLMQDSYILDLVSGVLMSWDTFNDGTEVVTFQLSDDMSIPKVVKFSEVLVGECFISPNSNVYMKTSDPFYGFCLKDSKIVNLIDIKNEDDVIVIPDLELRYKGNCIV